VRDTDQIDNGKVSLWMEMKMAMFSAGEPCKLFFSLWQPSVGFEIEIDCLIGWIMMRNFMDIIFFIISQIT